MIRVSPPARLNHVQHIIGSGTGVLEFAVENEYYTWVESENADWGVDDVSRVENLEEDRFIMYPAGESFVCEIEDGEKGGLVRCWSESE